jgi:ABC-2 type transport system ATP-binding protein
VSGLAIRCKNLVKRYPGGVTAVNGLDLDVREGECFGLLGPNGAGKTTTIEILEGILPQTSGEVEILGHAWGNGDRHIREKIGISLQETQLSEKLTVRETLRLFRSFYPEGLSPEQSIDLVSLGEKADARVGKLSGGQKQRLAVACAMVGDPRLLFLDEPTTGLDPQSRRQIWEILKRFRGEGRTILITTHYMDEAERLCDRVAVVDHGKVIALGSPRDLIASLGGEHMIELALANGAGPDGAAPDGAATKSATPRKAPPVSEQELIALPGVSSVRVDGTELALTVSEPHVTLPRLLERLGENGGVLTRLSIRHASLEDVFVKLTGRHLRDGETSA